MLRRLCETLVLPPASVILVFLAGTLLRRKRPRLGRVLQAAALLLLVVASMPATGGFLLCALQTHAPLPANGPLPEAQAIVVLSAEGDRYGSEYGGAVIGPTTMQRLRYGAFLQRRTGLPMLVSGGVPCRGSPSLAAMMRDAARDELHVPVRWVEDRSATTWENAAFSAAMLRAEGVRTVLLVSSAWHLPRAMASFRAHGLEPIAAPTAFRAPAVEGWTSFVPHWSGLKDTCLALHEWGGRLVYLVRS